MSAGAKIKNAMPAASAVPPMPLKAPCQNSRGRQFLSRSIREARNRGCNFLIERAYDPCPQCRGSTRSQILPQCGAHLIEVLKQRTALGAGSSMALDIRGGERIEFAVEVCLHAQ